MAGPEGPVSRPGDRSDVITDTRQNRDARLCLKTLVVSVFGKFQFIGSLYTGFAGQIRQRRTPQGTYFQAEPGVLGLHEWNVGCGRRGPTRPQRRPPVDAGRPVSPGGLLGNTGCLDWSLVANTQRIDQAEAPQVAFSAILYYHNL